MAETGNIGRSGLAVGDSRSARSLFGGQQMGDVERCTPPAILLDLASRGPLRSLPETIPAMRDRLRPFGLVSQSGARHAMEIGLLLNPAGIRVNLDSMVQQLYH